VHGRATPAPRHLRAAAEALGVQPRALTTTRPADAELYDRRVWAGLSIRTAAQAAGMPWQTYAAAESGARPLGDDRVAAFARAFGCSPSTLRAASRNTRMRRSRLSGEAGVEGAHGDPVDSRWPGAGQLPR
jgi:AraC-like DNA-binding protein